MADMPSRKSSDRAETIRELADAARGMFGDQAIHFVDSQIDAAADGAALASWQAVRAVLIR